MEKFSTWRDKGTGISPFMPAENVKGPLQKYITGPLLLLVKLPAFFILYSLSLIAPKAVIRLLLSLFVSAIDVLVEGVRKLKSAEIDKFKPTINDCIVSNYVSPLDVLLLFSISTASLGQTVVVIPSNGELYSYSVWQFVLESFTTLINGQKLTNFDTLKDKLVLFFPEGTPLNNKAVLPFSKTPEKLFSMANFNYKTVVLRVYPNSITLPVPYLSKFGYLLKTLGLARGFVKVKIVPATLKYTLAQAKLVFPENGLNFVDLGLDAKKRFFAYYSDYALANVTK